MSLVHERLRAASRSDANWYMRQPDGEIYGPTNITMLAEWAAQNRIVPGSEISEDMQNWIPAQELPDLKMEWAAHFPDGTVYEPFNVLAVPYLFENKTLPADTKLINKSTGKTLLVQELLKLKNPEEPAIPATEKTADLSPEENSKIMENLKKEAESSKQMLDETRQNIETLHKNISEMESRLETANNTIASLEKELTGQKKLNLDTSHHVSADTESKISALRNKYDTRISEMEEKLKTKTETLAQTKKELEEKKGLLEKTTTDLKEQTSLQSKLMASDSERESELNEQIEDLRHKILRANEYVANLEGEHSQLQEKSKQTQEEFERQIRSLEDELNASNNSLQDLQKEVHDKEGLCKCLQENLNSIKEETTKSAAKLHKNQSDLESQTAARIKIQEESQKREADLHHKVKQLETDLGSTRETLIHQQSKYSELEKQSAAKTYEFEKSKNTFQSQSAEAAARIEELQAQLRTEHSTRVQTQQGLSQKETELNSQVQKLQKEIHQTRQTLTDQQNENAQLQEKHASAIQEIEKQITIFKDRAESAATSAKRAEKQLQEQISTQAKLREKSEKHEAVLQKEIETLKSAREETQQKLNVLSEEHKTLLESGNAREKQLSENIAILEANLKAMAKTQITQKDIDAHAQLEEMKHKYAVLQEQLAKAQARAAIQEKPAVPGTAPIHYGIAELITGIKDTLMRYPLKVKAAIFAFMILICASVFTFINLSRRPDTSSAPEPSDSNEGEIIYEAAIQEPLLSPPVSEPAIETPQAQEIKTPPAPHPLPEIKMGDAIVTYSNSTYVIVFNYGLFSHRTRLAESAEIDLEQLAKQLQEHTADLILTIEGHTDTVPMGTGDSYSNNHALGMARAETVMDLLYTKYGIPKESMEAKSAGQDNPPYPNDTEIERKKNRTVVMYIRQKDASVNSTSP